MEEQKNKLCLDLSKKLSGKNVTLIEEEPQYGIFRVGKNYRIMIDNEPTKNFLNEENFIYTDDEYNELLDLLVTQINSYHN